MTGDDRLPILLVVLDGLGDRPSAELQGQTPSEAAATPVLDALAARGASGAHIPFGPGRSTSSETAHWSLFGFESVAFPGRAALEAVGVGLEPPTAVPMFHLALRAGEARDGALYLGARARPGRDEDDAAQLLAALEGRGEGGVGFEQLPLRIGECVLLARGATTRDVSDTDALFDHIHPWMRPQALADAEDPVAAAEFAAVLERWLQAGRALLRDHPVNAARKSRGLPSLEIPVTKWASWIDPAMPSFMQSVGLKGAAVTDTALYRGLARILKMDAIDVSYDSANPQLDMERRLAKAEQLLEQADFVHVHVKATDEAGHTKKPQFKREIIEATAAGLAPLLKLADRAIVAVTGDHATPSVSQLLHSGDPTPFTVAGPGIYPDGAERFGERYALQGACGRLAAADVLPLLVGYANRPFFRGHRPGPWASVALPNAPAPMPIQIAKE
jgi:2,3-bisphosphoglycerate-independent phosphoglycerate mutase